jgi:clan AA aspartic protease (TIGR02281 family)
MHKAAAGWLVLGLITGWGLGWYSHDHWKPEPQLSRVPVRMKPSSPPGLSKSADHLIPARPERDDAILQLLQDKAFARAVEAFEALQAQADDATLQRARDQLLGDARQLLVHADYDSAIQLLQRYLEAAYRDVEARMLLSEALRGADDPRAAIEQLYEAKGQAWRPEMLEQLSSRIRALVTDYAGRLRQSGDNNALLELYQALTQLEPSYAPYFIGLASAQLALADSDAARQSLLLVAQDPEVGARARELLEQLRVAATESQPPKTSATATDVAGIPLVRNANHFLVDARLGEAQARLLIDTGASLTMLTPEALQRRGVSAHNTGRTGFFSTANGRVSAPIYRLEALSVGGWQVSNLDVGVLEVDAPHFDGLLGMNFLGKFQFFIDQNASVLRLSVGVQSN